MKILVACEESQVVTISLRKRGHEAYSCDIINCSGGHPEWHLKQDVIPLLNEKWDMIIAFPPCTYLSNVSAPCLFKNGNINNERYEKGLKAKEFFMKIYNADCDKIAIENPVPLTIFGLPKYTQIVQPWQFGHEFQKKTCLWLKNLSLLIPTKIMQEREPTTKAGNWYNKQGKDRAKIRSKTFAGIAEAMAEQWTIQSKEEIKNV